MLHKSLYEPKTVPKVPPPFLRLQGGWINPAVNPLARNALYAQFRNGKRPIRPLPVVTLTFDLVVGVLRNEAILIVDLQSKTTHHKSVGEMLGVSSSVMLGVVLRASLLGLVAMIPNQAGVKHGHSDVVLRMLVLLN